MNPGTRSLLIPAAIFGFLGVALGAFAAHGLEGFLLANGRTAIWETAVRYQMYHALALLALAGLADRLEPVKLRWAGRCFVAGIIIFSGSLYLLALTNKGWFGAITPFGGVALLAGWTMVMASAWRGRA